MRVLDCGVEADAATVGNFMMWHRRLGNPNERVLKQMIRDKVCIGLPLQLTKTVPWEECAIAKSTKTDNVGLSMQHYDAPLSLVVADLIGPFQVQTLDGYMFALEIRDVYSTFLKTFLMKNKDESTALIKGYIAEAEQRTDRKVIFWCTDGGGGENLSTKLFNHFLKKKE